MRPEKETRTTTAITTDLRDAVKLVLDRLSDRQHVLITDKLLYRSEGQWHIDDLEQQPIISVPDLKEAAIYFVLMETPQVVIDALKPEIEIEAGPPLPGEIEVTLDF